MLTTSREGNYLRKTIGLVNLAFREVILLSHVILSF